MCSRREETINLTATRVDPVMLLAAYTQQSNEEKSGVRLHHNCSLSLSRLVLISLMHFFFFFLQFIDFL
jgi:hypothetical protein